MITYRVELWCEEGRHDDSGENQGCTEQYRGYPSAEVSNLEPLIAETVSDAVELDGWTTKDGKHYCPEHKAAA